MSSYVSFLLAYLFHGPAEQTPEVTGRSAASAALAANLSWPASDKAAWIEQVDQPCTLLVSRLGKAANSSGAAPASARQPLAELTEALQVLRQALEDARKLSRPELAGQQQPQAVWLQEGQLAECYEQLKVQEYYAGYDVFVGLRIASSLTILFVVFILFVVYKTGCHVDRRRRRRERRQLPAGAQPAN